MPAFFIFPICSDNTFFRSKPHHRLRHINEAQFIRAQFGKCRQYLGRIAGAEEIIAAVIPQFTHGVVGEGLCAAQGVSYFWQGFGVATNAQRRLVA